MTERLRTVGIRLEVDTLNYVKRISNLLHLDKSAALRMLLNEGIVADRKKHVSSIFLTFIYYGCISSTLRS